MRITVKEPATDTIVDLNAETEDYNGEQGWRIVFPDKDSFVMLQKNGEWVVMDEENINPQLINTIAKALEPHDRYTSMTGTGK